MEYWARSGHAAFGIARGPWRISISIALIHKSVIKINPDLIAALKPSACRGHHYRFRHHHRCHRSRRYPAIEAVVAAEAIAAKLMAVVDWIPAPAAAGSRCCCAQLVESRREIAGRPALMRESNTELNSSIHRARGCKDNDETEHLHQWIHPP